jgi:integrase
VPKFLPAEQIQRVLNSCDRNTAIGKRNYAILLLLARLGLRAGGVVAPTLEDVDWEACLNIVQARKFVRSCSASPWRLTKHIGKHKLIGTLPPSRSCDGPPYYLRSFQDELTQYSVFFRLIAPNRR